MFAVAAVFLLLSGIASLTYQVVWVRLLGLSMGSTSAAISTVLAAFFLGLALGSYLAERITRNRINDLKAYIVLEAVIGLSGLVLLPLLLNLEAMMAAIPALSATIPAKFAVTTTLLLIPTVCMGATFPVMASILIRRHREVGVRMSQLYSLNTAGAVLGAALAGFVFVPNWGLNGAVYIAVALNLLIVAVALSINKSLILPPIETATPEASESGSTSRAEEAPLRGRALIVLFATGFVAIATEVGWTKYLSIFTGTTIYGFAAILTIFLIGIAAGSWAIKSYLERMRHPELWMAGGLVLLGGSLLLTRGWLTWVPPIYQALNHFPAEPWVRHGVKYMLVFCMLFPPTFLFGALFPLNLRLYCGNLQGVRARIGKAYAVNTVASIFGSVLAGFWIIPYFGTDVLLTSMAMALLVLPFLFVPALRTQAARVAIASLVMLAVVSNWILPHISYQDLIGSVQYDNASRTGEEPEFLFLKEGKAGVISMVKFRDGYVRLQNNGLNESFLNPEDQNDVLLVENLLGMVPYMLHANPKSAFVVGFGGGVTTQALVNTKLESIRVVELEPAVVEAGQVVAGGAIPVLQDPRVTLTLNDARNTLLTENIQYDIIVAQPSHPWLARASNVFTKEFFSLVKSRLNEGGVYGQWVSLFHMDATTLKSLLRAFYEVFPQGMVFADLSGEGLIMYGSDAPLTFDFEQMMMRMSESQNRFVLERHAIYSVNDLLMYFALSREQALAASIDVPANSDTNILSEVRLSAIDEDPKGEEDPYRFLRSVYSLNLRPYLDDDVVQNLYDLGTYCLTQKSEPGLAQFVADQLRELDPLKARGIEYEILWSQYRLKEAEALFWQYEQWPERTYMQQALLLADASRFDEAMAMVPRIESEGLRRTVSARLLFDQQRYDELLTVTPEYDAEKLWYYSALAKKDLRKAGEGLHAVVQRELPALTQLYVLAGYYGAIHDQDRLGHVVRVIAERQQHEVNYILTLLEKALDGSQSEYAQALLKRLDKLNPKPSSRLQKLREKVSALAI